MRYNITDLIDIDELQKLMESFYNITKIPYGLLDSNGTILIGIGWQNICINFHRMNIKTALRCEESDLLVLRSIDPNKEFGIHECKNGLLDAFAPIIVEDEHIATLFLGQFFLKSPDIERFRKQAEEYGFDVNEYLEALSKVPILTKDKVEAYMAYYAKLAKMLSNVGLDRLKKNETEKLLLKQKEHLENMVMERTSKLYEINKKLEKDILRRECIEKELMESKERYKKLIEFLPYGVCVFSENTILFSNKTAAVYFGVDNPKSMIGKKLDDLFYPQSEYQETYETKMEQLLETGYIELAEEKLVRKFDGKNLDIEATFSFIPFNGTNSILVVFRDITERIQLKEKIEMEQLRKEFFSNLSHEFKTPITLIYSTIQLFEAEMSRKDIEMDKVNRRLEIMKQNCNRMIGLINNLLDISKIEAGYFELVFQNHDIVGIIQDIIVSLKEYMTNKGIKLLFHTNLKIKIMTIDPYAIERAVLNLLSNAVKFSNQGDIITVKLYEKKENIFISVRDTGIGMRQDNLDFIFDRFKQVDKSFSRKNEGSGIGLSIVKEIIHMHGGEITVKSEYNVGSEFIIKLPINQANFKEENLTDLAINYERANLIKMAQIEFADIYS